MCVYRMCAIHTHTNFKRCSRQDTVCVLKNNFERTSNFQLRFRSSYFYSQPYTESYVYARSHCYLLAIFITFSTQFLVLNMEEGTRLQK